MCLYSGCNFVSIPDVTFAQTLLEYLTFNFTGTDGARAAYSADVQELFTLWNGFEPNHIIVYTGDGEGFVFESYVLRIGALLAHILLGRNPVVPSLGKWTQLPDSADFVLRFSLSGFGCRLFQYALAGALSSNDSECQDVSDDFLQDLNWKAPTGKKYKLALGNLTDADWTAELLIFVIAAEPLRILCSTYLKWSLEDAVVQ